MAVHLLDGVGGAILTTDTGDQLTGDISVSVMPLRFGLHASWIVLAIGISLGLFVATS